MVETPKPVVLRKTGWLLLVATLILHAYLAWHLKDYIRNGYTDFTIFYSAGKILRDEIYSLRSIFISSALHRAEAHPPSPLKGYGAVSTIFCSGLWPDLRGGG